MSIEMQPVGSSNIAEIGYDAARRLLRVRFTNNALYEYQDVPEADFHNLRTATSVGRYFGNSIKNVYESTRLEAGKPKDPAKLDERTKQLDAFRALRDAVVMAAIAWAHAKGSDIVQRAEMLEAVCKYEQHPLALKPEPEPAPTA